MFSVLDEEIAKAKIVAEQLSRLTPERNLDLERCQEKGSQLQERWHRVIAQLETRWVVAPPFSSFRIQELGFIKNSYFCVCSFKGRSWKGGVEIKWQCTFWPRQVTGSWDHQPQSSPEASFWVAVMVPLLCPRSYPGQQWWQWCPRIWTGKVTERSFLKDKTRVLALVLTSFVSLLIMGLCRISCFLFIC